MCSFGSPQERAFSLVRRSVFCYVGAVVFSGRTWERIATAARTLFRRHWQRALILRDWIRLSEEAVNLLIAGAVGLVAGLTTWAYLGANQLIQWAVLGRTGNLLEIAEQLPYWQRVLAPAAGGLAAGLILYWGLRLIGTPGLSNLLEVVVAGDGRLSLRTAVMNALSSLVSISTGASIGREGLLIQLSATLASKSGQVAKWPPYRLRLLVACGAAAGVAAALNAPIAGAVFAAQIVLGNFSMNMFAPLVVSSVVASMISRGIFGIQQLYEVPQFNFTKLSELPWFILLGVLAGLLGACFLKAVRYMEQVYSKTKWPLHARLASAGLAVGVIAIVFPEVWGNGYTATSRMLHGELSDRVDFIPGVPAAIQFMVGLLAAKFIATMVTVGAGTVGGIFTPTLFVGAGLGSLFGTLLHFSGTPVPTGIFAIVGMGSLLSATTHSPLLSILMIFEMSLNYSIMPPLMLACVISTLVARRIHPESIYTEPLRRKGVELQRESTHVGAATESTVGDILRPPVPPLQENTPFREIADRFISQTYNFLPVVDKKGHLLGVVALQDLKEWLNADHELSSVIAYDVMRPPPTCLTPVQKLTDVLPLLLASEVRNVPVVNNLSECKLIGTIARSEALSLLSEAISAHSRPTVTH